MRLLLFVSFLAWISLTYAERCEIQEISITKNLLDSSIKQYYYASEDSHDIYLLTHAGTVYRSTDGGMTFLNKMSSFPQWDNVTLSYPNDKTGISKIHGAGTSSVVYFEGHGMAYWVTRGDDIYKLYKTGYKSNGTVVGDFISKISANPYNSRALFITLFDSVCFATDYENCFLRTEVSQFQGAENSWVTVNNYTFRASWGSHEDQLFVVSLDPAYWDEYPNQFDVSSLNPHKNLLAMSNYGAAVDITVPKVVDFSFKNGDLYFIKYAENLEDVAAYVSTELYSANEMIFGGTPNITGNTLVYHILEASADLSFIAAQIYTNRPYGNLFQGATHDPHYWVSLENIRINSNGVDFYKTEDLPGIYLANLYDNNFLDDADLEVHIQSRISFDEGGEWHPLYTTEACDDCKVNLFLTSEYTGQPITSAENTAGILYSLGNEGANRQAPQDDIALYLSRSGGYRWERVLDGMHFFSFNARGSLIMALDSSRNINSLKYSWDQGLSWNSCSWGDETFQVVTVVPITGYPNGLQFLIYGQFPNGAGIAMYVDFLDNTPRICTEDDFELFEPQIGGMCLLGQSRSYLRRKRESLCVPLAYEQEHSIEYSCECTRQDFQCDGECFEEQHVEGELNTICVNICEGQDNDPTLPPNNCDHGYYLKTQGYRKIPNDQCIGGEEYLPVLTPCGNMPSIDPTPTISGSSTPVPPPPSTTPSPSVTPSPSSLPSTTPTPTVEQKSESSTPSPSLTLKGSESISPTATAPVPSVTPTTSFIFSDSATLAPSPSATRSADATISNIATPSETRSADTLVKSESATPSPSQTQKTESSPSNSVTEEAQTTESTGFPIPIVVGASVGAGCLGVLCFACLGLIIVIVKKRGTGRSKAARLADEDVFSLEDNDEWEL